MVGRSLDAQNECSVPALLEETPKALRVAVVEDDPRIQQLISAEITDEGHTCICFGSAEDFLDEAGSDRFDLLLLDLICLLYTSPSPRDPKTSRMPSSA